MGIFNDVLWLVDLGWSDGVEYDLLSSTLAFEHAGAIGSMSDLVGRSHHYEIRPAGFLVGSDTIWRLQPIRQNH